MSGKTIQLKANWNDGEGTIKVSEHFDNASAMEKLDLLRDWIHLLQEQYDETHANLWAELPPIGNEIVEW